MCWTMRSIIFILLFLLTKGIFCFAEKNYRFESITVENGLSQSSVNSMVQDKFGFLWIGTQDGLNKYDGNNFNVYRNKEGDSTSLINNDVHRLYIDTNNILWIATARIRYSRKRTREKIQQQEELLKSSIDIREEERKRIAQDLHDELGAALSIAGMYVVQLQDQGSKANTEDRLQQVRTLTETALPTMRRISHHLMPPQLEEFGLIKTLQALATQLNETKKIASSFLPPEQITRLPKPIEPGIYRVCMELVNNTLKHTLKHACATHIQLLQGQHSDLFLFSNNGKGLPENYTRGHGFRNMEARINTVGGNFKFGNRDEGGFYSTLQLEV